MCLALRFLRLFLINCCLLQGWDDVSFHGSPQIPTPTLDGLANSGVILNNYYVSPMDSPSRAAFMTGKYALNLGNKFILFRNMMHRTNCVNALQSPIYM